MIETLHESIKKSLIDMKISKLTEIQELTIPHILNGKNVVGLSATGSGKTLAFLIPAITKTIGLPKKDLKVLILTPTKELCGQIHNVTKKLTKNNNLLSMKIIGGENFNEQVRDMKKGQHILLATPGRLQEHVVRESFDFSKIDIVVLDEADVMMDMGYFPQIEAIMAACENRIQTLLFSATMSEEANELVSQFVGDHELIDLNSNSPKSSISEFFCPIKPELKVPFLKFLIKQEKIRAGLIFCNTKSGARLLFETMLAAKYKVAMIEGEMSTHQRKQSLDKLRRKEIQFLIATDVASRGIDIPHVTHIINYEVPLNRDSYIHRIGRTARHDGVGTAFTLCHLEHEENNILRITEEITVRKYKEFDYNLKLKKK